MAVFKAWSGVPAEQGIALLVALVMLVALLVIGASAARMALHGEKAARAERDRHLAFQAAEDALTDAERDIVGGARGALFAAHNATPFEAGCGAGGDNLGLCARAAAGAAPVWQSFDLAGDGDGDGNAARAVPYGRYTGARMETGAGILPFRQPRYIVERIPYHPPGSEVGGEPQILYRVTAIGFGTRAGSETVLQSAYRKADE